MKNRSWLNPVLFVALVATSALALLIPPRNVARPNFELLPEAQMSTTPAFQSLSLNPNFADHMTQRVPPRGSRAREQTPFHYEPNPQDALRAGRELGNPFTDRDAAHVERGGFVFTHYCQVCHGPLGQGNGPVTQGGFPPPASLLAERAVQMKDGQMFHVLTLGQGNMPPFRSMLSGDDRWNVILHVRLLQEPYSSSQAPSRSAEAAKLFRENCAACHGQDGTGSTVRAVLPLIPDFTSLAWQTSQTEMAIVNQIDYGSHPMMPAFRYKLTPDQILSLAVYVRTFAAHAGAAPSVVASTSHITASNVYGTFCYACHDTTGKGNPTIRSSMPELPDFTAASWQKSRSDADLAHSILQGKGKFMLPMQDKLGNVDVKQMVALVRGFEGAKQVIALEAPKAPGPPAPVTVTAPSAILSPSVAATPGKEPGHATPEPLIAPSGEAAARIRIGASIFRQYCIVCHGPDGTGGIMRGSMPVIPDFTSDAFHRAHSDAQIYVSILDGKGTLMPANRGRVTEDQARDLTAYIRAFGPKMFAIRTPASNTEFDKSFHKLEEQWNELQKELQKTRGN